MDAWMDMGDMDLIPVDGWSCMRTTSISAEGVSTVIVLMLMRQDTGEPEAFVFTPDVGMRMAYDVLGDSCGITEYEEEEL